MVDQLALQKVWRTICVTNEAKLRKKNRIKDKLKCHCDKAKTLMTAVKKT